MAPPHSTLTSDHCVLPLPSLSTIAMHAKIRCKCTVVIAYTVCYRGCVCMCLSRLMDKVKHHLVQVAEASKQLSTNQPPAITAALLETYSRLLIWLGTRNFQSKGSVYCSLMPGTYSTPTSSFDSCGVQESGMACAACIAGGHCLSCAPSTAVFIPLPAPAATTHCGGRVHYSHTALCLVILM